MNYLYIDESGSMTKEYSDSQPYFVICIVKTDDPKKLKRQYKRFVSEHFEELKQTDKARRMFLDGKFKELKGNEFTPTLKKDFVEHFCRNNLIEVFYIIVYNKRISSESFYANTARAFNYLLKNALQYFVKTNKMDNSGFNLQLDERNERPDSVRFLQNYLNTELFLTGFTSEESTVTYYDSAGNKIVQIADVFANFMFSHLMRGNYKEQFEKMKNEGYIKAIFKFPLN